MEWKIVLLLLRLETCIKIKIKEKHFFEHWDRMVQRFYIFCLEW